MKREQRVSYKVPKLVNLSKMVAGRVLRSLYCKSLYPTKEACSLNEKHTKEHTHMGHLFISQQQKGLMGGGG